MVKTDRQLSVKLSVYFVAVREEFSRRFRLNEIPIV